MSGSGLRGDDATGGKKVLIMPSLDKVATASQPMTQKVYLWTSGRIG
jgi:hypothetical protein